MPPTRRALLAAAGLATTSVPLRRAAAQAPAVDLLRLFVPSGAGGGWDSVARAMERVLRENGQIGGAQVENVTGAGGAIGLPRFIALRGRRNTLMVSGLSMLSAVIATRSPVSLADVIPLARLQGEAFVLVVPASSPIRDIAQFVAELRANPRGMSVGAGAAGGVDHMMYGLLGKALGIPANQLAYVAFNSGGPAATAILGGQVRAGLSGFAEWQGHIEAGRMRVLGISSSERLPGIDIPTLREGGVDCVFYNWRALFAPPGIPEEHAGQLEALVEAMARSGAWQSECERRGWQQLYLPRREFAPWLSQETASVEAVLKDLGLAS